MALNCYPYFDVFEGYISHKDKINLIAITLRETSKLMLQGRMLVFV